MTREELITNLEKELENGYEDFHPYVVEVLMPLIDKYVEEKMPIY